MLCHRALRFTTVFLASLFGLACSSSDTKAPDGSPGPTTFESDTPGSAGSASGSCTGLASLRCAVRGQGAAGSSGVAVSAPGNGAEGNDGSGSAARAIEEADIIKMDGNRLYALSQFGGLSIIDVSTRDQLRLLGRKKVQAVPFEMYTRANTVFALYNGYEEYVRNETNDGWNWVTTSSVVAFDATDPAEIVEIGRFSVPGTISDSRIVGDILYVVGFENGACWGCGSSPRTTILSLDVKSPGAIHKIDELTFNDPLNYAYSWQRSITVTDQRMYVAGPEYGASGAIGSQIQVVDISDPGGDLVEGTSVRAAGRISNRWQMDEFEGVLRVISQKGDWRADLPPKIQTFRVASADSVVPLGSADMTIPLNEDLRSVRFDGPRGYAITALQTDPLFTIDLSDPALPRQVGELEIPGWVYHMEPRGERVLGLGFDQNNPAGALNISLFDVSNFAAPRLVKRVNFGGDWASVSEDQDRIHKAFKIVDDAGLILMPFSGWTRGDDVNGCNGRYQTGIQLVDWMNDDLTLAGIAPASGLARRGFLHDERLFAVSDDRVETFDISDRNTPKSTADLALSHWVSRTIPSGDKVIRVARNWQTNVTEIDVTKVGNVTSPESLGRLTIGDVAQNRCTGSSWLRDVVADGNRVYVVYNVSEYTPGPFYKETSSTRVLTVDVSNPQAPIQVGDAVLDFGQSYGYGGIAGAVDRGEALVVSGSALVALSGESVFDAMGRSLGAKMALRVVDMSDPNAPSVVTHELAATDGVTGLHVSGKEVAFGHYSLVNPERARFYLSRFDVSDPTKPLLLGTTNVPGSLMAYDARSQRALTADYRRETIGGISPDQCYTRYVNAQFRYDDNVWNPNGIGSCSVVYHGIRLVQIGQSGATVIGSVDLGANESIGSSALGDDRLFVLLQGNQYRFYGPAIGVSTSTGIGYSPVVEVDLPLLVVGGLSSGTFRLGRLALKGGDAYGYSPIAAVGTQAVLSSGWRGKLTVVDATDVQAPRAVREESVFGNVEHLVTAGNVGIASLGQDGVQTIPVGK